MGESSSLSVPARSNSTAGSLTGQLASQLAMLPSLSSMIDECVPLKTSSLASSNAQQRRKKLNNASALSAADYWRAYASGDIYLNDPEQPSFVSNSAVEIPALLPASEAVRLPAADAIMEALSESVQPLQQLAGIVERICGALKASEARIELVLDSEVVTVAKAVSGKMATPSAVLCTPSGAQAERRNLFGLREDRSSSPSGHAILADAAVSLIVNDLQSDWRFRQLGQALPLRFYAGLAIRDAHGHAIGVLSVRGAEPRPNGFTLGQENLLIRTAAETASELLSAKRAQVTAKLSKLDETIRAWAYCPAPMTTSESLSSSLSTPRIGTTAPPSPSIAERRKAKAPAELSIPASPSATLLAKASESQHPEQKRLQKAVDAICEGLGVDTVYVASITSSESLETRALVVSHGSKHNVRSLDAPLHLCALATGQQGLTLRGERAAQLLGEEEADVDVPCQSAFTIRCLTPEQEQSGLCTDGWVLGAACCAEDYDFGAQEVLLYLQRFAKLLGLVLAEGPAPVSTGASGCKPDGSRAAPASRGRKSSSASKSGNTSSNSSASAGAGQPTHAVIGRPRRSSESSAQYQRGSRARSSSVSSAVRILPAASPPPSGPLPLPPLPAMLPIVLPDAAPSSSPTTVAAAPTNVAHAAAAAGVMPLSSSRGASAANVAAAREKAEQVRLRKHAQESPAAAAATGGKLSTSKSLGNLKKAAANKANSASVMPLPMPSEGLPALPLSTSSSKASGTAAAAIAPVVLGKRISKKHHGGSTGSSGGGSALKGRGRANSTGATGHYHHTGPQKLASPNAARWAEQDALLQWEVAEAEAELEKVLVLDHLFA